jgi:hypothetical protein
VGDSAELEFIDWLVLMLVSAITIYCPCAPTQLLSTSIVEVLEKERFDSLGNHHKLK